LRSDSGVDSQAGNTAERKKSTGFEYLQCNEWSDDEQYIELLEKAKEINLHNLVNTDYI